MLFISRAYQTELNLQQIQYFLVEGRSLSDNWH
jgi:hypothetical protein